MLDSCLFQDTKTKNHLSYDVDITEDFANPPSFSHFPTFTVINHRGTWYCIAIPSASNLTLFLVNFPSCSQKIYYDNQQVFTFEFSILLLNIVNSLQTMDVTNMWLSPIWLSVQISLSYNLGFLLQVVQAANGISVFSFS